MDGNYSCWGCWQPWSGAVRGKGRRRQRGCATLSLRAGTRPGAGPVTHLGTCPGLLEGSPLGMDGSGRPEGLWWFVLLPMSRWPGLLFTSSIGAVTSRAFTSLWLMILTNSRCGSIPKCGCILPLLRDMIWWPWHHCVNGWTLSWVSFPT